VLGGGYFLLRRAGKEALLLMGCVLSHWVLDFITHGPDLPLVPGGAAKVGLGLWNFFLAAVVVEGALFVLGVALYVRATVARDRAGSYGLWLLIGLLVVLWVGTMVAPPPPNDTAVALTALALWLMVPWAYWIDRHRKFVG
jgi:hypothetical protein